MAMMTIISFLIARQYGADGYGDFVKITTYVGFFYLFADFGLNAIYVQDALEQTGKRRVSSAWNILFALRLTMSAVLVLCAVAILALFPKGADQGYTPLVRFGIMMLIPAIIVQATTTTTNAFFQKILRYDLATHAQNAGSLVMVGVAAVLMTVTRINGSLVGVYAVFSGSIITAFVALWLVRFYGQIHPLFHVKAMRALFVQTVPLGLTLVFNLIYFHADSVVLALTRSTAEVGVYGLAYKIFEIPLVFPLFFMNSVFPMLVKTSQTRTNDVRNIFSQSFIVLSGVSVVALVALWALAPAVVLIRPEFAASIAPLRVLLLGLPVYFVSSLFMWMLITKKKRWSLFAIHTCAMVVNIVLNSVFIPSYGYMAAAWVTVGAEVFVLVLSAVLIFRTTQQIR